MTKATIRARLIAHGWVLGYRLLRRSMRASNTSYDYVFQTRHDLYMETPITEWPGFRHKQLDRILLELEGRSCTWSCIDDCPRHPMRICSVGKMPLVRNDAHCRTPCTADHMMWIPGRFLNAVIETVVEEYRQNEYWSPHYLWPALQQRAPQTTREGVGFLFPDCKEYPIDLSCKPGLAYRPARPV